MIQAFYSQNTTYNASHLREIVDSLFPQTQGVLGGLNITLPTAGTPSISVSAGRAIATTTSAAVTGGATFIVHSTTDYLAKKDVGGSTTWQPASAGTSRVDTVYARVHDLEIEASGSDSADIYWHEGTEADIGAATPEALTSTHITAILGYIYSANNSFVTAVLTDYFSGHPSRTTVAPIGGAIVGHSQSRPTSAEPGTRFYEADSMRKMIYTGTEWESDSAVLICTSSTRPTGDRLFSGLRIFEEDTGSSWIRWSNTWRSDTAPAICTSSTRPTGAAAFEGASVYESDTNALLFHDGSDWRPAGNVPWGVVGQATVSSSTTGITTTPVEIGGLSVTWTAVAGRRYRIEANALMSCDTSGRNLRADIYDGSNALVRRGEAHAGVANEGISVVSVAYVTGTGSMTAKVKCSIHSGSGSATLAGAIEPAYLTVEDIGPV